MASGGRGGGTGGNEVGLDHDQESDDEFDEFEPLVETVARSPVYRVIANELAYTMLAEPDGSANKADHWQDPEVVSATMAIASGLKAAGYEIVAAPRPVSKSKLMRIGEFLATEGYSILDRMGKKPGN
jgi:hypothetical protein